MPIATIQTPDGSTVKLEVPEGATEAQILEFVQSQDLSKLKAPTTAAGTEKSIGETALGVAGEFASGVNRGIINLADLPADVANYLTGLTGSDLRVARLADIPGMDSVTDGGFVDGNVGKAIGMVGEFVAPVPPIAQLAKPARRVAGSADELIDVAKMSKQAFKQSPKNKQLVQQIAKDPKNADYADKAVDAFGALKTDPLAEAVIKQGIGENVVAALKTGSTLDKKIMRGMLSIYKRGKKDALFQRKVRPADAAGKSLLKRINQLSSINKKAGKNIGKAAEKLKGQSVDLSDPIIKMADSLDGFGVSLKKGKDGLLAADFKNSSLAPGDRGAIKEVVRQMSRLSNKKGGFVDAFDAHELKRIIDRNVSYGKVKSGLGGDAEAALKGFRRSLDGALDSKFPSYKKHNDIYAETIEASKKIQKAVGTNIDFTGDNAGMALGTSLRRLFGNTQSRATMYDGLDDIEKVLRKNGVKLSDDIARQAMFADEIDKLLGTTASTSLKGQVAQAGKTGQELAREAESLGQTTMFGGMLKAGAKAYDYSQGINEENAIKALDKLLKVSQ